MRRTVTRLACIALLALAPGCQRRLERVTMRLGPADFLSTPPPAHEPVVQIDDEARPVLVAPEAIPIADESFQRAGDGRVGWPVTLPDRALGLPDEAFVLTAKRQDFHPGEDEIALGNAILHEETIATWRLVRTAGNERAAVVEAHVPPSLGEQFALFLRAFGATPAQLESRPFMLPPDSRLVLRYGVAGGAGGAPVRFRAWLECGAGKTWTVHQAMVAAPAGSEGAWGQAIVRMPAARRPCRLRLRHHAPPGGGTRGVWSPPYFLGTDTDTRQPRNVVVISLDTLRSDHLSGYGYRRATSPAIDARMIGRGTTFLGATTTFPLTREAHMSLFTGLYADAQPNAHTVPADSPVRMLTELMRDSGFEAEAYTEDALLAGAFGFWHGFGRFTERAFVDAARGRDTFRDGARFVREHRDRRFFLFLHTYKVHSPYTSGPDYASYFTDPADALATIAPAVPAAHREAMNHYDRAIREADDQVAAFLDVLDETGIADQTLVVLLSDHGEAFGEHGVVGHGLGGNQEQLAIALVFRGPGIGAYRVATPVSLVDVAPTLLETMALPALEQTQGQSLRRAFAGEPLPPDRPIFFGWIGGGRTGGVRIGTTKYLSIAGRSEVFDLTRDPGETTPTQTDAGALAQLLVTAQDGDAGVRERLAAGTKTPAGGPAVPAKVEKSLKALGYL